MSDIYSIESTDPADLPTIRRLIPGGQTMQVRTGGSIPGVFLQPGTTQGLRYAACLAEDIGPHLRGKAIVRDPKGKCVDGLVLAAEVHAGRYSAGQRS